MKHHRMKRRDREQIDSLFKMAAPGCAPWRCAERSCPTNERRGLPNTQQLQHCAARSKRGWGVQGVRI